MWRFVDVYKGRILGTGSWLEFLLAPHLRPGMLTSHSHYFINMYVFVRRHLFCSHWKIRMPNTHDEYEISFATTAKKFIPTFIMFTSYSWCSRCSWCCQTQIFNDNNARRIRLPHTRTILVTSAIPYHRNIFNPMFKQTHTHTHTERTSEFNTTDEIGLWLRQCERDYPHGEWHCAACLMPSACSACVFSANPTAL